MQWFDETVGASLDESRGTKKDVIEDALRRLQIGEKERRETVMVGDRKHDILAASALELSSVGVTFGYAPEGELKTALALGQHRILCRRAGSISSEIEAFMPNIRISKRRLL